MTSTTVLISGSEEIHNRYSAFIRDPVLPYVHARKSSIPRAFLSRRQEFKGLRQAPFYECKANREQWVKDKRSMSLDRNFHFTLFTFDINLQFSELYLIQ
jgi:hypothetical protein